jgi:Family of unknown function (DUF5670)
MFSKAPHRVNWPRFVHRSEPGKEVDPVLWTIIAILAVLWLLGVVGAYTIGPIIHLLLVVALVLFVAQLMTGRRAL